VPPRIWLLSRATDAQHHPGRTWPGAQPLRSRTIRTITLQHSSRRSQPVSASTRWFLIVLAFLGTLAVGFLLGEMYGQRDSEPVQAMLQRIAEAATPRPTRTLRPTRTAVPTRTPVPTATPVPTPTVNFSLTTAALWSRHKSATELQWPVYVEDISGMRVAWQGSGEFTCSS